MKTNLLERRQECLKLRSKGFSLAYIVKELAEKYEVTPRAIYYDWKQRKAWLQGLLEIKDPQTFFLDILATHKEIYKQAVLEQLKADNSSARIGALNLQRKLNKDLAEMLLYRDAVDRLERLEERTKLERKGEWKIL